MDEQQADAANAERRERVVHAVLQRIADAPPRAAVAVTPLPLPRAWVDVAAWRVPALAAAAILMMVSGLVILKTENDVPPEQFAGASGGLPQPVARYLETGVVAPMEWLDTYGGRR